MRAGPGSMEVQFSTDRLYTGYQPTSADLPCLLLGTLDGCPAFWAHFVVVNPAFVLVGSLKGPSIQLEKFEVPLHPINAAL